MERESQSAKLFFCRIRKELGDLEVVNYDNHATTIAELEMYSRGNRNIISTQMLHSEGEG